MNLAGLNNLEFFAASSQGEAQETSGNTRAGDSEFLHEFFALLEGPASEGIESLMGSSQAEDPHSALQSSEQEGVNAAVSSFDLNLGTLEHQTNALQDWASLQGRMTATTTQEVAGLGVSQGGMTATPSPEVVGLGLSQGGMTATPSPEVAGLGLSQGGMTVTPSPEVAGLGLSQGGMTATPSPEVAGLGVSQGGMTVTPSPEVAGLGVSQGGMTATPSPEVVGLSSPPAVRLGSPSTSGQIESQGISLPGLAESVDKETAQGYLEQPSEGQAGEGETREDLKSLRVPKTSIAGSRPSEPQNISSIRLAESVGKETAKGYLAQSSERESGSSQSGQNAVSQSRVIEQPISRVTSQPALFQMSPGPGQPESQNTGMGIEPGAAGAGSFVKSGQEDTAAGENASDQTRLQAKMNSAADEVESNESSTERHSDPNSSVKQTVSAEQFKMGTSGPSTSSLVRNTGDVAVSVPPIETQGSPESGSRNADLGVQSANTVPGQAYLSHSEETIAQIVQSARLMKQAEQTTFNLRLKPEFLGKIRIDTVLNSNHTLTATITVEDPAVKVLLESHLPTLLERFEQAGVKMGSVTFQDLSADSGSDSNRPKSDTESGGKNDPQGDSGQPGSEPGQEKDGLFTRQELDDGRMHYFA